MEIIDESGRKREIIEHSLKRITHTYKDGVTGEITTKEFVQFTIVGKNRDWMDWCPLDIFKANNPEARI